MAERHGFQTAVLDARGCVLSVSNGLTKFMADSQPRPDSALVDAVIEPLRESLRELLTRAMHDDNDLASSSAAGCELPNGEHVSLTVQSLEKSKGERNYLVIFETCTPKEGDHQPDNRQGASRGQESNVLWEVVNDAASQTDRELQDAHLQLKNLLRSSQIASIFLDRHACVRNFTPAVERIYELSGHSIGTPLSEVPSKAHFMPPLPHPDELEGDDPIEHEISTFDGEWYLRRVRPFFNEVGMVDGVVVTFVEITARKKAEQAITENQSRLHVEREKLLAALVDVKAAEAKLRVLFDQSFFWLGILDLEGNLIDVNRVALEDFNFKRDNVVGMPFWETPWWEGHPASQEQLRDGLAAKLRGEDFVKELAYRRPDGGVGISEVIYRAGCDEDGNVLFVVVTGNDVTTRHLAEKKLQESQAQLRLGLDIANVAIMHVDYTDDTVTLSPAAAEMCGFGVEEETVTRTEFYQRVHPEDRLAIEDEVQQLLSGAGNDVLARELRMVLPCGDIRWLSLRKRVFMDTSQNPPLLHRGVIAVRDVTTEREQLRRVKASENRLRLALGAAELRLWQWDVQENCWSWSGPRENCPDILEPADVTVLEDVLKLIHPEDRDRFYHRLEESISHGKPFRTEYRVLRNCEYRWVISMAHVSEEDLDSPRQMIGVELDITERKATELKLEKARQQAEIANESKSAFLANMSHEIRTPMTSILGYTDLAQTTTDAEERAAHLSTIRRNGEFLLDIINDILDLSKIEARKLEVRYEAFDPVHLLADVQSIMHVRAAENNLQLNIRLEADLPGQVECDPKRLKQILINLVGNAIKFTDEGKVEVAVRYFADEVSSTETESDRDVPARPAESSSSGYLEFEVLDTGIGMTPRQKRSLFQPFTQGDNRVNRDFGGTGLGLAISQRLAKILGGNIKVESTLGEGSRFTCRVKVRPLGDRTQAQPTLPVMQKAVEASNQEPRLNCRILIVDDRRDIRFLSKQLLSKAGATIEEAEDGFHALEQVKQSREKGAEYDCILLDMQMPRLDGYRTAKRLRKLNFQNPIIALTAEAMDGDSNRCIESGCTDYLSKPIDAEALLRVVGAATAQT